MENKEPKSSKAILIFGILVIGSAIITAFLYLISTKNPDFIVQTRFMFALTSVFGVAFQVYMKEFRVKDNWGKLPFAFRFGWWLLFIVHGLNFTFYIMETFIL
ncbi:hypothetical protein [Priestia sp. YIM B13489]|uniref:hypothetical protein n=1 Tax=Priestia sp. YIM B13489 TaxID=3366313 RepID=UPI00366A70D0